MINRLPRWVWTGSSLLALIGGSVNAVGFLSFEHHGITHLTGSTTLLGISLAKGDSVTLLHFLSVILAFLMGCILSGYLVRDSTLKLGRRYGVALSLESVCLFVSVPFLNRNREAGILLASCACGLQNGMVSTYSGAVLRTTHVSGLFTDVGIFIGQILGGVKVDQRRMRLYVLLLSSFLVGTILGTAGFAWIGNNILLFPATLTGVTGLGYSIYRQKELSANAKLNR
jgi:uncharacterized membrane protein YoaK (UPF0700 family)